MHMIVNKIHTQTHIVRNTLTLKDREILIFGILNVNNKLTAHHSENLLIQSTSIVIMNWIFDLLFSIY